MQCSNHNGLFAEKIDDRLVSAQWPSAYDIKVNKPLHLMHWQNDNRQLRAKISIYWEQILGKLSTSIAVGESSIRSVATVCPFQSHFSYIRWSLASLYERRHASKGYTRNHVRQQQQQQHQQNKQANNNQRVSCEYIQPAPECLVGGICENWRVIIMQIVLLHGSVFAKRWRFGFVTF